VHLFDEMVKTIPDSARLASMQQSGDTLTLQGVAQSNASVANYMRNLDSSKWLTHSDLIKTEVKGNDKRNRYEFGLNVKLRPPENAENLDVGPENPPAAATSPTPAMPLHGAPTPMIGMPAEQGTPAPSPDPAPAPAPAKPATGKSGGNP
jgi:type IV pilus assembly protein PilN